MHFNRLFIKRVVFAVIALAVLFGVYILTVGVLKATLRVTTEETTTITIYSLPQRELVWSASGESDYEIRVNRGEYSIELSDGEKASRKVLSLGFRESLELNVQTKELKDYVRLSGQEVSSIGVYNDTLVGPHVRTPVLLDISGKTVYSNFRDKFTELVFGPSEVFAEIQDDGDIAFIESGKSRVVYDSKNSTEDIPIDIHYNKKSGSFCALLSNGEILSLTLNGSINSIIEPGEYRSYVRCLGDSVVTGTYREIADAEGKPREGSAELFVDGEVEERLDVKLLTDIEFIDETSLILADNNVVSTYAVEPRIKVPLQTIDSLSSDVFFVDENMSVYVFDESVVWQLSTTELRADKIAGGANFRAVNSATTSVDGDIVFSVDSRSNDSGIYKFTDDTKLATQAQILQNTLPADSFFYFVDYTIVDDKITVGVVILGDIPISKSSKEIARKRATSFIASLNLSDDVKIEYR